MSLTKAQGVKIYIKTVNYINIAKNSNFHTLNDVVKSIEEFDKQLKKFSEFKGCKFIH